MVSAPSVSVSYHMCLMNCFSGGHTIGISHCPAVSPRLYNSTGPGGIDPTMDSEYAENLKANKCKTASDNTTILEMDPGSRKTFDLSYYSLLLKRRGLFQSDAALTTDSTSLAFINQLLSSPTQFFFDEFGKAMEKMGRINVKTGSEGEIRKQCALQVQSLSKMAGTSSTRIVLVVVFGVLALIGSAQAQLQMNFYASSCPKAEQIVLDYVKQHIPNAPSLAASFLRMHFHDCIVRVNFCLFLFYIYIRPLIRLSQPWCGIETRSENDTIFIFCGQGCDASVLLNSTSGQAEKNAVPNLTLRGFDFIERVKSLLEAECPGVVSCADILTLVARDSVEGLFWNVPIGRRDGVISNITEANTNIPSPFHNFTTLLTLFSNQGLNLTICEYAENLKANKCKTASDNTTILEMDPGSQKTFDLSYYSLLLKRKGLFQSDAALTTDSTSLAFINQLLTSPPQFFFDEFAKAMEKMGRATIKEIGDEVNNVKALLPDGGYMGLYSDYYMEANTSFVIDSHRGVHVSLDSHKGVQIHTIDFATKSLSTESTTKAFL
ncbi:hypothetical protein J1N35_043718 [Gossypium stocksii]|uniref:peroxidase n=1 Tax=Gossypium stocksii TaxID=47602 RepID=A0A9D3U809_9ROSI|nr:hypothetical protein J1N35_043718 [Gossypium stocksii]